MASVRTLILLRHAKSAYPGGVRDQDRPLADRGRHEAGLAAQWLQGNATQVDAVLCSTALRTRQTVEILGLDAPVRFADEVYEAAPDEVLDQVRATAAQAQTLLVCGHAPGLPGLTLELAGPGSSTQAVDEASVRFPDRGHRGSGSRAGLGGLGGRGRPAGRVPHPEGLIPAS